MPSLFLLLFLSIKVFQISAAACDEEASGLLTENDFIEKYMQELDFTEKHRRAEEYNAIHFDSPTRCCLSDLNNKILIDIIDHKGKSELFDFLTPENINSSFYYWNVFRNTYGSIFAFACAVGKKSLVYELFKRGSDVNKISVPADGRFSTPLLLLITSPYRLNQSDKARIELIQFLLDNGASIHYVGGGIPWDDTETFSLLSLLACKDSDVSPTVKKVICSFMQKKYGSEQFLIKYLVDIELSRKKSLYYDSQIKNSDQQKAVQYCIAQKSFKQKDMLELIKHEAAIPNMPKDIIHIFTQYAQWHDILEKHIPVDDVVAIVFLYLDDSIYQEDSIPLAPLLPAKIESLQKKKGSAECCLIS